MPEVIKEKLLRMKISPDSVYALLREKIRSAGIEFEFRSTSESKWRELEVKTNYFPVEYSLAVTEFAVAQAVEGRSVIDVSMILVYNNRSCGLWPLSLAQDKEGCWELGSNGGGLLPPIFLEGLERKSVKTMVTRCLTFVFDLCRCLGQKELISTEPFLPKLGFGDWYNQLLLVESSSVTIGHDLYLDLAPPLEKIRRNFRKSYKPLISMGEKLWKVNLIVRDDPLTWNRFMQLHREVSGKVTRAIDTWDCQYRAIVQGDAFLVTIEGADGRMVGGGYFRTTQYEGVYGSGAYDRELFDKPLGHVVQWHAIKELKQRGVSWYKLGTRFYPGLVPRPTDKEISISIFKQGFASHLMPSFRVKIEI